jgi:hypothetical protein
MFKFRINNKDRTRNILKLVYAVASAWAAYIRKEAEAIGSYALLYKQCYLFFIICIATVMNFNRAMYTAVPMFILSILVGVIRFAVIGNVRNRSA